MQLLPILLSLITAATAIDIRFQQDCNGGWFAACSNINPEVCCQISGSAPALLFAAIPNWSVEIWASPYSDCGGNEAFVTTIRNEDRCAWNPNRPWGSGKYRIVNKKMARDEVEQPCQRVDTFHTEDGTKYSLTDLEDGQIQYLTEQAGNGTVQAAIKELKLIAI